MKVLFLGDIFGKPGRQLVLEYINNLKDTYTPDVIIVNGENLADGKGLTEKTTRPLFDAGVDAITGGNHLWDRHEALGYIQSEPRIVKPMNYPSPAPGNLFHTIGLKGYSLRLFCLTGQMFMPPCDSPFTAFDRYWEEYKTDEVPVILDFHAESTAEKRAMGWHVDGKISAILGTHTHIQTADEEVLEQGTAYITDVGMTGAHDSVIGIKKNLILEKMRTGVPVRYEVSNRGLQINGVLLNIDEISRKALSIERIRTLVGD